MIRDKADRTVSIGNSETVVTAGQSYFFKIGLIKYSLILVDELVITVYRSGPIDEQNRVIREIMCVGELDIVEEDTKT